MAGKEHGFTTYDIYQAAYFCMNGLDVELVKDNKGKVVFCFDSNGRIEDLIKQYNDGCDVNVLKFVSVAKSLRNKMYSILKSQ